MSEKAKEQEVGGPEIVEAETPTTEVEGEEAGVVAKPKPSPVKFAIVALLFIAAVGVIGTKVVQSFNQNTQPEAVVDLGGSTTGGGLAAKTGGELPPPPVTGGSDYMIGGVATQADLPVSIEGGKKAAAPEGATLPEPDPSSAVLLTKAANMEKLLSAVLKNQETLMERLQAHDGRVAAMMAEVKGVRGDVGAVIVSSEAIAASLKKQQRSVSTVEAVVVEDREAERLKQQRPTFRVSSSSVWGDHVSLIVETADGFYKPAEVGGRAIQGWILKRIDIENRQSWWQKEGVTHVLPIG